MWQLRNRASVLGAVEGLGVNRGLWEVSALECFGSASMVAAAGSY